MLLQYLTNIYPVMLTNKTAKTISFFATESDICILRYIWELHVLLLHLYFSNVLLRQQRTYSNHFIYHVL